MNKTFELQSQEYSAMAELATQYHNLLVDDDYPKARQKYENALHAFIDAIHANGRLDDLLRA